MWLFMIALVILPVTHLSAQTTRTPTASVTPSMTDSVEVTPTPTLTQSVVATPTPTNAPRVELTPTPTVTQLSTPIVPRGSIYFDFEDGDQGWIGTGLWHRTTRWPPESIYDTPTSWWFGDETSGTYNVGRPISGTLTSPRLVLIPAKIPVVMYRYRYAIEQRAPKMYDVMSVQISRDDGKTWQDVEVLNQTEPLLTTRRGNSILSLPQYMGQVMMIRFIFDTVDGQENGFEGWYVDDVAIKFRSIPLPPPTQTITLTPRITSTPTATPTTVSTPRPVDTTEPRPLPVTPSARPSVTSTALLIAAPQLLPMTGANSEKLVP